ncbi:MAG: hypothetical protein V2A71_06260 [Candidatus Eisenbacteria bacterium]
MPRQGEGSEGTMNYAQFKELLHEVQTQKEYPPPSASEYGVPMSLALYEGLKADLAPAWHPGMPMRGPVALEDLVCPHCGSTGLEWGSDYWIHCGGCIRGWWASIDDYTADCAELDEGSGAPSVGDRAARYTREVLYDEKGSAAFRQGAEELTGIRLLHALGARPY